jgi:hypothetical protein
VQQRLGIVTYPLMQQSGMVARKNRRLNMKTLIATLVGQGKNPRVVAAALLAAGAVGGWAMSTTITTSATAFEDLARIEAPREKLQLEASKPSLIGSYVVTGTDSDGKRYAGPGIVSIALAQDEGCERDQDRLSWLRGSVNQGWAREDLKRLERLLRPDLCGYNLMEAPSSVAGY